MLQPPLTRAAGVLLPVTSLASPFGVGTLGLEAYRFVDFLARARQSYWQVLPVGPTGYGDSPYQSFSAFAGNPYLIDLRLLAQEGLIKRNQLPSTQPGREGRVDYEALFYERLPLLREAFAGRGWEKVAPFCGFCEQNAWWLEDYALYMALKGAHQNAEWLAWEAPLRLRDAQAMADAVREHKEEVLFWKVCQYFFFKQWMDLKQYANQSGVQIIGDIPLYVSLDSADVWAGKELFELDEEGQPLRVAGVPPDNYSADGQRWGNPLYRWEGMEQDDFSWWKKRVAHAARLYDLLRIDHFIGTTRFYTIPAKQQTAKGGRWQRGPGLKLMQAIQSAAGKVPIIAEDLGVLHPCVERVLQKTGFPGMKVLLFGFDGHPDNAHLPHNFPRNAVAYTGTHDNETVAGYFKDHGKRESAVMLRYLGVKSPQEAVPALIRLAYQSVANTVIIPVQDLLGLDNSARINTPSTLGDNWNFRLLPGALGKGLCKWLGELTVLTGRAHNPERAGDRL